MEWGMNSIGVWEIWGEKLCLFTNKSQGGEEGSLMWCRGNIKLLGGKGVVLFITIFFMEIWQDNNSTQLLSDGGVLVSKYILVNALSMKTGSWSRFSEKQESKIIGIISGGVWVWECIQWFNIKMGS